MRREFIPQTAGQIVDQQDIAKMIFAAPINAMRLKRIAAVRAKEHNAPSRLEHPHHLLHRGLVILHMLQHLMAEDYVYAASGEGQMFASATNHQLRKGMAFLHPWELDIQPDSLPA